MDAATLAAAADRLQGGAGLTHRKVAVDGPLGARLADGFRALGWTVAELVVMRHDGRPLDAEGAEEVGPREMERLWLEDLQSRYRDSPELVRQLVAAQHLRREATPVGYFGARGEDGRLVSACELFSDGGTAQVESVSTLESHRGRGHGRAVVSAAVTSARTGGHDRVYIVAEAADWPACWYERLGFEPVGSIWDFLRTPDALRALRLRTPRLELRLPTDEELRELAELARLGIHPPERTPFIVPWTDRAAEPSFVDDVCAYHRETLARWSPGDWQLNLVAFVEGRVAGTQGIAAERFAERREVHTGSWLGAEFQNRGLGTEMRAAVLELAFAGLGTRAATSGAFEDNPRSARVSEKLGYAEVGEATHAPRGAPVRERLFRLERSAWRSPVPVTIEALGPALPWFGLTSGRSRRTPPAGPAS
ncbi:MAG TPA: GNAT family N-acetyltransferase [Gaiellaceae bacterium]|nr:GNAT family N-acetyltransferase [Gaiellaceae bacterium]